MGHRGEMAVVARRLGPGWVLGPARAGAVAPARATADLGKATRLLADLRAPRQAVQLLERELVHFLARGSGMTPPHGARVSNP